MPLFDGPLGYHFFASDAHMASATVTGSKACANLIEEKVEIYVQKNSYS